MIPDPVRPLTGLAAVATDAVDEVVPLDRLAARIGAAWAPAC